MTASVRAFHHRRGYLSGAMGEEWTRVRACSSTRALGGKPP